MASQRSPTPASSADASTPTTPVTPRTKLKQLFATIDDSSDDEGSSRQSKTTELSNNKDQSSSSSPRRTTTTNNSEEQTEPHESSDEDVDIIRPRGRLASRMQAEVRVRAPSEPQLDEDARERVRRLLQKNASKKMDRAANNASIEDANGKPNNQEEEGEEEEEDEDILSRHPRRRAARQATPKETPSRELSPDLFVTPTKEKPPSLGSEGSGSDDDHDDLPDNLMRSKRFQARVAEIRAKRLAREAEEMQRKNMSQDSATDGQHAIDSFIDDEDEDPDAITDDEGGRRLTQGADRRPAARKASKKALEEMHRETQRMSRSLQLAHEAKTKKKITKASLFERFNFRPAGAAATGMQPSPEKAVVPAAVAAASSSRPSSPVSAHHTDTEMRDPVMRDPETPPSSPPLAGKASKLDKAASVYSVRQEAGTHTVVPGNDHSDREFPEIETLMSHAAENVTSKKLDKGKGKATAADFLEEARAEKPKRQFRVRLPTTVQQQVNVLTLDGDDELVITETKKNKSKLDAMFDRVPARLGGESHSMQALRVLAQIGGSPDGKKDSASAARKRARFGRFGGGGGGDGDRPTMTAAELQLSLHLRAREQARLERERRLEALRAKGVHIQTAEERERELQEVEDIVARARREAEELMRREREDAKKEGKAERGEAAADPLAWDDSDEDDDYVEESRPQQEQQELPEVEISGSEDEEADKDEDEDEDEDKQDAEMASVDGEDEAIDHTEDDASDKNSDAGGLIDDEAESTEDSANEEEDNDDDMTGPARVKKYHRVKKQVTIISDDEDEDDNGEESVQPTPRNPFLAVEATPKPKTTAAFFKSPATGDHHKSDSPQMPTSVLRSATKTFIPGLPVKAGVAAGLGLTQIFAGTMDDSQAGGSMAGFGSPSQPMPTFDGSSLAGDRGIKFPGLVDSQPQHMSDEGIVVDSQQPQAHTHLPEEEETQGVQLHYTQSQTHGLDSLLRDDVDNGDGFATQQSDWLELTQDEGFQRRSPLKRRFVEEGTPVPTASIVATEVAVAQGQSQPRKQVGSASTPGEHPDSPLMQKKGKLRRKITIAEEEDEEEGSVDGSDDHDGHAVTALNGDGEGDSQIEGAAAEDDDEFGFGFGFGKSKNAFSLLRDAEERRQRQEAKEAVFDRKKSKAKEMVQDQAEESEDEYAGLGGVDGEDDSGEDDGEDVKAMIDDKTAATETDKAKIAAFYADRERASDEKQVEKLFKDITSGMLRRKRAAAGGGDYDLSDEDDGGEARRRLKRRQFAKMQKALFADERVSKVAENPRTRAFMRTIEDRGSDEEMDFLFEAAPPPHRSLSSSNESPQPREQQQQQQRQDGEDVAIPDSQPGAGAGAGAGAAGTTMGPPSRAMPAAAIPGIGGGVVTNNPRRTKSAAPGISRPASLGEIRESLSSLLEDRRSAGSFVIPATEPDDEDSGSGDDDADADAEDNGGGRKRPTSSGSGGNKENRNPRRSRVGKAVAVVDRISLKRSGSSLSSSSSLSLSSATGGGGRRSAFAAGAAASGVFKVPALLRRATTNSSLLLSSTSSSSSGNTGVTTTTTATGSANAAAAGGFGGGEVKVRKGSGQRSGVNYFARENERRAAMAEKERRREARKLKGVEGRGKVVGGLFGRGRFE